ncbi:MAG TPA: protein phosphatase 2C domain-containing protein [Caulobacteraceae bacterium]
MSAPLRLVDAARTDVGKVRKRNEDSLLADRERGLWAVADGMGGFENGQWASQAVIDGLSKIELARDFDADAIIVADALHEANGRIGAESAALGKPMGSTVVAVLIEDRRFAVLWAGDCRAYLLRGGALHRLSRDHTQVQELVERGYLAPEDAPHHPMSHVVSRAIGVEPTLEVDVVTDEVQVGDVFFLCSDGLHGIVSDAEIGHTLGALRPGPACGRLLEMALGRGAPDNVTLIAVACDQVTQHTLPPTSGGES